MKTIPLREDGEIKSRDVIAQVAKYAGKEGINVDEMRRRIRILDALDAATGDALQLEDADHAVLVRALKGFPFAVAHRDLLRIVDDIEEAGGSN